MSEGHHTKGRPARKRGRLARWSACGAVLISLALVTSAHAARAPSPIACAAREGGGGKVVKIIAPLEIELDNGTRVALSEIGTPQLSKDRPGTDIASAVLAREALGKNVRLYFDGDESDRHGRALAQVWIEGATPPWLQRSLVDEGAAYVDPWPTNRTCAADLLAHESEARGSARGLWGDPANRILFAEDARSAIGHFAIVEGKVVSVTRLKSPPRIYIDFGLDWHTDFTIRIEAKAVHLFNKAKLDPESWKGQVLRMRGYVGWRFGPEVEVTSPEEIEFIQRPDEASDAGDE